MDHIVEEGREWSKHVRRGEHAAMVGIGVAQTAQRWHSGQQITEPERTEDDKPRAPVGRGVRHGHDGSVDGAITISRTSQPAG